MRASNRRQFLKASLVGSATFAAAASFPRSVAAALTKPMKDQFAGLKIGMASYSLRKFSLDEAIAMTRQAGVKYITLKDMHLPMKSTREEREAAHRKIQAAGLQLMGGGVIYMKNREAEIRAAFDYARDAGMPTIVCSPDVDALDTVEKMAKEYDIRIAIHNHGPGDQKYPSPVDVFKLVKDRDSRMGICMDVGHTVRIKQDPIEVMQVCASRLYDYHIKDVNAANEKGSGVPVGRGVIDIPAILSLMVKMKFAYHVALEYEENADAPMPGITESYGYMRGVLAGV